jgi:DNA-binding response OmpR family regulator
MKVQPAEARSSMEAMKTRILVIDDDAAMLNLLRSVLEAAGYECRVASSAEEGLGILKSTPDILVAISDINMPGMDGIMFLRAIGSAEALSSIPRVLFLTAHPQVDYAVAALRLGAIDFLSKPVLARELLDVVKKAVERVRSERQALELPAQAANLARQAEALAEALKSLRNLAPAPADRLASEHGPARAGDSRRRMDLALLGLDHLRRPRRTFAALGELDDVGWDLLLQLLRAEHEEERLSVSALSISVEQASPTTALRRIQELVKAGHVVREPDPLDARRDFVALSVESRAALETYLQQVADELAAAAMR